MKIKIKIYIVFALVMLFMFGIWHIDLTYNLVAGTRGTEMKVMMTNGFGFYDVVQIFHIGLYLVILSFIGMGILTLNEISVNKK